MKRRNLVYKIGGPVQGYIEYDDAQAFPKVLYTIVLNGNPVGAKGILDYLAMSRVFEVPFEFVDRVGSRVETHPPTDSMAWFEQSLQTIGARFGIFLA